MEIQPVPDSTPNPVVLLPFRKSGTKTAERKEEICFYCKRPLSQCENPEHWNKKLGTEGLDIGRGMSIRGEQNFVLVDSTPAAMEDFEKVIFHSDTGTESGGDEGKDGLVRPKGAGPDPESDIARTPDYCWIEKASWKKAEELEEKFVRDFIEKCPKLPLALSWLHSFPEQFQRIILTDWIERHLVNGAAVAAALAENIQHRIKITITLECSCGVCVERTLPIPEGLEVGESVPFHCADCLGRLIAPGFRRRQKRRKDLQTAKAA